jgi:hypothetical protein
MAVRLTAGLLPYSNPRYGFSFCCVLATAPSIVKERQVKNALLSYLVTVCKLHKPSLGASCTVRTLAKESADSPKSSGCYIKTKAIVINLYLSVLSGRHTIED